MLQESAILNGKIRGFSAVFRNQPGSPPLYSGKKAGLNDSSVHNHDRDPVFPEDGGDF